MTDLFCSTVLLLMRIVMKKEALKKECFSSRNRFSKNDNAIQPGFKRLKPWV